MYFVTFHHCYKLCKMIALLFYFQPMLLFSEYSFIDQSHFHKSTLLNCCNCPWMYLSTVQEWLPAHANVPCPWAMHLSSPLSCERRTADEYSASLPLSGQVKYLWEFSPPADPSAALQGASWKVPRQGYKVGEWLQRLTSSELFTDTEYVEYFVGWEFDPKVQYRHLNVCCSSDCACIREAQMHASTVIHAQALSASIVSVFCMFACLSHSQPSVAVSAKCFFLPCFPFFHSLVSISHVSHADVTVLLTGDPFTPQKLFICYLHDWVIAGEVKESWTA